MTLESTPLELLEKAKRLEAIGVLTRSATHDLNNHMAAILTFADLVLEALPADHPIRVAVEEIQLAGFRAVAHGRALPDRTQARADWNEAMKASSMMSSIEQVMLDTMKHEEVVRFTRGVHQLGSEVISILGFVEAALAVIDTDPELRSDLEEMRAAAIRAAAKIAELDRRTDGKPTLHLVPA